MVETPAAAPSAGSRPLIGPGSDRKQRVEHHISGWSTTSGSLDGPLTQLYFGRPDRNSYAVCGIAMRNPSFTETTSRAFLHRAASFSR